MKKHIKKENTGVTCKTVEEVKDYLKNMEKNWTILDYLERYWYIYFWNYVSSIPLKIKSFFQRGIRGWANEDTWGFDDYLTDVIIEGITHLRQYAHGYPCNVKSLKEWKKILKTIIIGFKAYKRSVYVYKNKKTYKKQMYKFSKGMKLFVKHYGALWD